MARIDSWNRNHFQRPILLKAREQNGGGVNDQARPVLERRSTVRRFFRISVRQILIVILVFACALACIVRYLRSVYSQRDAVAEIRRFSGEVWYEFPWATSDTGKSPWYWVTGHNYLGKQSMEPHWLLDRTGPDYFGHVTIVNYDGRFGVESDHLKPVAGLTGIQELELWGTWTDDVGLSYLKELTTLRKLRVSGTGKISDAGLAHLRALTNLEQLHLRSDRITDAGLAHLKNLTKLRYLSISSAKVTDAGLQMLSQALPSTNIERDMGLKPQTWKHAK
jgi:hypothetical protein